MASFAVVWNGTIAGAPPPLTDGLFPRCLHAVRCMSLSEIAPSLTRLLLATARGGGPMLTCRCPPPCWRRWSGGMMWQTARCCAEEERSSA